VPGIRYCQNLKSSIEQSIQSKTSVKSILSIQSKNGRAEVQIRVIFNFVRTNMIASGLTGKIWARAIFYAVDILNIQYQAD
jgi:hypothetical protein